MGKPIQRININLPLDAYNIAQAHQIGWTEALKKGIGVLIYEKEWGCTIGEKLKKLSAKIAELSRKLEEKQ